MIKKYAITLAMTIGSTFAVTTFTEGFAAGNANWAGPSADTFLTHVSTGGAPASSGGFVSTDFTFGNANTFGITLFRGQDGINSSDDAFVGDYQSSGVTSLSFYVRHNVGVDLDYSLRLAPTVNFPGVSVIPVSSTVPSGEWTELFFDFTNSSTVQFQSGAPADVLPIVGNLQIGIGQPMGVDTSSAFTFDLDGVSIVAVPEPSSVALILFSGVSLLLRRRRIS